MKIENTQVYGLENAIRCAKFPMTTNPELMTSELTKGIAKFMIVMGITSSIIDVLAFLTFWHLLGYNSIDKESYFQTAWFITSLITELMIIYNVRTSKDIFNSRPSKVLLSYLIPTILNLKSLLSSITKFLLNNLSISSLYSSN